MNIDVSVFAQVAVGGRHVVRQLVQCFDRRVGFV
jgi:hypothetical protein